MKLCYVSPFVFSMYFRINLTGGRLKEGGVYLIISVLGGVYSKGRLKEGGVYSKHSSIYTDNRYPGDKNRFKVLRIALEECLFERSLTLLC